jgi:hypothetical protein
VVGGSITIPHVRRAVETLEEIREDANNVGRNGETGKRGKGKRKQ